MASETVDFDDIYESAAVLPGRPLEGEAAPADDADRIIDAFRAFTDASCSLESAFGQLQRRVERLSEELEAKNRDLERSLREKQEAQEYLRTILERLPCGVFVLEDGGEMTLCNPMAADVLRKARDKAGRFKNSELRKLFAASADGRREETEIALAASGERRVLATSGTPLEDEQGRALGTLHIIRDVTLVKALEERTQRGERLAAMGEMAAELAHEIRNPLGSIELFASLLGRECAGDAKLWAENIRISARSLNTIVSNMLHFSGPLSPVFAETDMHEVVRDVGAFCEPMMRQRGVRWEMALEAEVALAWADRGLFKQLLLNLIFNAMKAMPAAGSLTVRTRNVARPADGVDDVDARRHLLELQLRDTGVGIAPEHLQRIFDPFFTTNRNGTGLGLSIVHQIVQSHSGDIRVESEVGRGTAFTITLDTLP
ncbi:MAG: PAS domain-containing protein [Acidobacteriota bacterium]|jgi:signal transduction histidine kinase|nr:PAS domain-containing protein [Acidobacteriota bacterium]